jgi:hypothetical protein
MAQGGRPWRALFQLLLAAGVALMATTLEPFVGRTLALLGDQASIPANDFGTVLLGAPTALTSSPQGHDVALSWSAGTNGTGYALSGGASSSGDCSGAILTGVGLATDTAYADAARYTPQGTWFCYQVVTARSTWSSLTNNPLTSVQLGFVANSVSLLNGGDTTGCGAGEFGAADEVDCGDQVVIAFNQAVNSSTGPNSADTVCTHESSDTLWLGSTTSTGACTGGESVTLGTLTGGTLGACDCRYSATYAWSGDSRTLTVTVGTRVEGISDASLSASTWTFTPSTNTAALLSATGEYHICDSDAGGADCRPETP